MLFDMSNLLKSPITQFGRNRPNLRFDITQTRQAEIGARDLLGEMR